MLRRSKFLSLFMISLVVVMLLGTNISFASEYIQADEANIKLSSMRDDLKIRTNPIVISGNAKSLLMWCSLKDLNNKNPHIKVSKIEIVQKGNLVARANIVESRSVSGSYRTDSLEFINSFENTNGENIVDIVFYLGSKEVARVKDYIFEVYTHPVVSEVWINEIGVQIDKMNLSIEMINVSEYADVEAYLVDDSNHKVATMDKVIDDWYEERDLKRSMEFGLSFLSQEYLKAGERYKIVVTLDGKKIDIVDSLDEFIGVYDECQYSEVLHSKMPNLQYDVTGINFINNGPYKLVILQDDVVTKELEGIQAVFNEDRYEEVIILPLLPEYFSEYGEMYNTELYNKNGELILSFTFLEPIDDTSNVVDRVDAFEGFEVFDIKEDIEPDKVWKVKFNKPIDFNSINKSNVYIINKQTGLSIDVEYKLQPNGKVIEISPLKGEFESGQEYILIVEDRVIAGKANIGENLGIDKNKRLSKPAIAEFRVK